MAARYVQDVSEQTDRVVENSRQYVIKGKTGRGFAGLFDMTFHRTVLFRAQQRAANRHQANQANA